MKYLQLIGSIIFAITIAYFLIRHFILFYKDSKKIKAEIGSNSIETEDLRIWSMFTRSFLIDLGENYQYAKFIFCNNEVYVFLRHSLPQTYNGPFVIKANESSNYSYLSKFYITKFKISGNDLTIHFKHKYYIGMKFGLNIININTADMEKIKSNLC